MPEPAVPREDESLSHDKILRTLARHFLRDLVEILFPDLAAEIDFTSPKFLGGKLFADFRKRGHVEPDVVVELRSRDGEPQVALFHAEMEHTRRSVMDKRLKVYNHQLALEFDDVPVLSAVIYLNGGPDNGLEVCEVVTSFKGFVTNRFYYVGFSLSQSLAEDWVDRPQALAAALAALMRSKVWDRVEQKIHCLEAVERADLDDEKRYLLAKTVDHYLELDEDEKARFDTEIRREEHQEVGTMIQTLSEAIQASETRGEARGVHVGEARLLTQQVQLKFGPLDDKTRQRIVDADSEDLMRWAANVLTAERLDDVFADA